MALYALNTTNNLNKMGIASRKIKSKLPANRHVYTVINKSDMKFCSSV